MTLDRKGFTLLEFLVVLSIILILTAITVPSYRSAQRQYALENAAQKLVQDIRRVEEMAMASKEIINPKNSTEKIFPKGGYGIHFQQTPQEIIIFADCNNNQLYTSGNHCGSGMNKFPELVESLTLESGIIITDLSPSPFCDIVFKPPDPTVSINPGSATSATITLSLVNDRTKTKKIHISNSGLIYVE